MDKTAELIEIVQHYPILYDTSHADYKDNRIKNKIWESVAETLKEKEGEVAKSRWKNLRDSYSKHLRATSGEDSNKYIARYKYWPWSTQMSFLQPFLEGIPTRSNRGVSKKPKPVRVHEYSDLQEVHFKTEESTSNDVSNEEPIFVDPQMDMHEETSEYYINDIKGANGSINTMSYDETDLIFLGYSKLIKKMSKKQQASVKYKIAKVIMDAEMEDAESPPPKKSKHSTYKSDSE